MQPGGIITPGSPNDPQEPEVPEQPAQPTEPTEAAPAVQEAAPEAGWHFTAGDENMAEMAPDFDQVPAVTWTASEFMAHDKNASWYLAVVLGSVLLAGIIYVISREVVSPVVVIILGISFAAFGARKPRVLEYALDGAGVHIGQRFYPYGMFKTFSIIEEDATRSILLMPLQRFNLPISIYYEPADEERIVEALSASLPHEDRKPAAIDNFMRKIHF